MNKFVPVEGYGI